MKTRFTYVGDTVIEVVVDGDSVEVNLLPAPKEMGLPPANTGNAGSEEQPILEPPVASEPALLAAPLELCAAPPPPTPAQRASKGGIRAMWTGVFSAGGVALVYALDNLTALNLSPAVGLAVGAVGYGAKAAIFPNTKL